MAYNEELLIRVRAALAHLPKVQEKKMFSGITFMVNGKMCISVGNNRIMCRIDPSIHDTTVCKPGCRPVIMKGKEYKGFVHVDEDVIETEDKLEYLVKLALDYNKIAKASIKTKRKVRQDYGR